MEGKILIIDEDRPLTKNLKVELTRRGFLVRTCATGRQGLQAIAQDPYDVVLTAIMLPDINGIELCREISSNWSDIPVVIMTAFGNMDTAIGAIRAGAYDFITKPCEINILHIALDRAVQHRELRKTVKRLNKLVQKTESFDDIIGESTCMQAMFTKLMRVAQCEATVLLTGESGSGKELAARAIHKLSCRSARPLIAVNCAAMPETLLENELFGHVKGAFTDARTDQKGLFFQAEGGTLVLDEIGELPLSLQPKLLRVLEEHSVRPLGGLNEKQFNVRVIGITNRNLEQAVEEGTFREDLLYRLNVITVKIPPLRSRGTDILLLAEYFMELFASHQGKQLDGMTTNTAQKLMLYRWPGNVRELRNAMEHAVTLTNHSKIIPDDLPERILQNHHALDSEDTPGFEIPELLPLAEVVQQYIQHVLHAVDNNQTQAAKIMQVDRKTLYRKLHPVQSPATPPSSSSV